MAVNQNPIRDFIVENLMFGSQRSFDDSDSFMELGIIDSTSVMELILFLEESHEVKIDDHEVVPDNLDSIEKIVRFMGEKMAQKKAQETKGDTAAA